MVPAFTTKRYFAASYLLIHYLLTFFILAIAEVYKNEGNDSYRQNDFNNAIYFYTEGIKVNCKDEELKAKLYSNRANAHFCLGEKFLLTINWFIKISKGSSIKPSSICFLLILCSFSGKYTDSLRDAKAACSLQPSRVKAILTGTQLNVRSV